MLAQPLAKRLVDAIRDAIPDVIAVYVFGSAARGDERPGSDLDLAFLARRPLPPTDRWTLQERLGVIAGRDVDLVDLRAASAVMRVQVFPEGGLLHDADPRARAWFEAIALADYARLNEERRAILDDIKRTGSVHG